MYIFMISRGIPSNEDPQWGCFEYEQAEALVSLGHKVVVACVDSRFLWRFRRFGIEHKTIHGIEYYNAFFCPGSILRLFGKELSFKLRKWAINKIFRKIIKSQGKPDIIYGHFFFNTVLGVEIRNKYGIPLVGIEHAGRFNFDKIDNNTKLLTDKVYGSIIDNPHIAPNIDGLISVSASLRQSLHRHFDIDSQVIHNMAGKGFTYRERINSGTSTLITVGSLVKGKGFDLLIKAFAQAKMNNWQLFIVGEGEEHHALQSQIDQLGLQSQIKLLGIKTKQEIIELLHNSDVFVLPSRNENFSVAVLEALACGLPVIASLCGGIRECIDETNGLLFEVDDLEGLTKHLRYMNIHFKEYNRKAIADYYTRNYSPQVIANKLITYFSDVINNAKQVN